MTTTNTPLGDEGMRALVADPDLAARFWSKVAKGSPSDCWLWRGYGLRTGYGSIRAHGISFRAHRLAFILDRKRLPDGLVRHKCDNPPCVNPHHLDEGSHADNTRDCIERHRAGGFTQANRIKTHCPAGHPLAGDNLIVKRQGWRSCRACARIQVRAYKQRKRHER